MKGLYFGIVYALKRVKEMSAGRVKINMSVMLLGDSEVGKTKWLKEIHTRLNYARADVIDTPKRNYNHFTDVSRSDFNNIDHVKIDFPIKATTYAFVCLNANANVKFEKTIDSWMCNSKLDAFFIFYDVNDRSTFDNADQYVKRIKLNRYNQSAKILFIGLHHNGQPDVSQAEAELKAKTLGLESYYAVQVQIDNDITLFQPFNYIIKHSDKKRMQVDIPDIGACKKAIDNALKYCKDETRIVNLQDFQKLLDEFVQFDSNMDMQHYDDLEKTCQRVQDEAEKIYAGAYPERVKIAVFGAAAAVLIATSIACGLSLLFLPVLLAGMIAACAVCACAGLASGGFSIFKAIEDSQYAAVKEEASAFNAVLPKFSYH